VQQYAPSKPHDRMRECRTCQHFKGRTTGIVQGFEHLQGNLVYCERDLPALKVSPLHGSCCSWMRAIGADDD